MNLQERSRKLVDRRPRRGIHSWVVRVLLVVAVSLLVIDLMVGLLVLAVPVSIEKVSVYVPPCPGQLTGWAANFYYQLVNRGDRDAYATVWLLLDEALYEERIHFSSAHSLSEHGGSIYTSGCTTSLSIRLYRVTYL
ncbi:MAG TPA: hypothetical protein VI999_04920 [Thermoplasmata archaeon]|nr:hypothetical protein [Thermoplasmata archaeon]